MEYAKEVFVDECVYDECCVVQVMSALDNPHIIHLEEVYEDDDRVSFILELAKVTLTLTVVF